MAVNKAERFEAETKAHALAHEGGVQAIRHLLYLQRDEINRTWPDMVGEMLVKLQGEAKMVQRLIRTIEYGPAYKPMVQE